MSSQSKTIYELILTCLCDNKNYWTPGYEIRHFIYFNTIGGLKISEVELRDLIKKLRFGGHPIIATTKGYKLAKDNQELQEYITSRKLELESELNILRKMEGKW